MSLTVQINQMLVVGRDAVDQAKAKVRMGMATSVAGSSDGHALIL